MESNISEQDCIDSESEFIESGSEYVPDSDTESSESEPMFLPSLPLSGISRSAGRKWDEDYHSGALRKFQEISADEDAVSSSSQCQSQTSQRTASVNVPSIADLQAAGLYVSSSNLAVPSSLISKQQRSSARAEAPLSTAATSSTHGCEDCVTTSNDRDSSISVYVALKTQKGKRKWDKAASCYFCTKISTSTNVSAHILSVHKTEPQVADVLTKPKGSSERALLLEKLRNLGNFKHNCEVLKRGSGQLIPWRAPSEQVEAGDYSPCEHCLGFFRKKELWRHENKCKFSTDSKKGRRVISRSQMLLPAGANCSDDLRDNVFSSMIADEVTLVARNDNLIVAYGEKLYEKHGHLKHQRSYIRQKLRELARFLLLARQNPEITNLQSCIDPSKFPSLISAVRKLCGYSPEHHSYKNPSLALKIGHSLKKCATALRTIALFEGNTILKERCEYFRELCEAEWNTYISSSAHSSLERRKQNKTHRLPLTQDISLVSEYLKEERQKRHCDLKKAPSASTWHALAKVTLAYLILFNRRRSGEAARMLLSDYSAAKSNSVPEDDVLQALSELEKQLLNNFRRVEIRGKHGRKVPVLLTAAACEEIDTLIEMRDVVGVSKSNEYVFARPYFSSEDHMAGHEVLHAVALESGAKEPSNITGTKLRKHLATVCQILNLTEHELEQVCGYMGHSIAVHREFYRLPQDTYQLAKVSRLLLCMEQGKLNHFQGKTMDDIQIDPEFSESEMEPETHTKNKDVVDVEFDSALELGERLTQTKSPRNNRPRTRSQHPDGCKAVPVPPQSNDVSMTPVSSGVIQKSKPLTSQSRDMLSKEEKDIILKIFRQHIDNRVVPRKADCEEALKTEPLLQNKSWLKLKCTVRNEIEKTKRQIRKFHRS